MARKSYNTTAQGLAIRMADGQLVPSTPKILAQAGFMEYHGPAHLNGAQALNWMRTQGGAGRRPVIGMDDEPFDIRIANKQELLEFAEDEYGVTLDATADVEVLRNQVRSVVRDQMAAERAANNARNNAARKQAAAASGLEDETDPSADAQQQPQIESPAPKRGKAKADTAAAGIS